MIVFVAPDGRIYTEGRLGYVHDGDLKNPEPGAELHELGAILSFVRDSFAPDCWVINDNQIMRAARCE